MISCFCDCRRNWEIFYTYHKWRIVVLWASGSVSLTHILYSSLQVGHLLHCLGPGLWLTDICHGGIGHNAFPIQFCVLVSEFMYMSWPLGDQSNIYEQQIGIENKNLNWAFENLFYPIWTTLWNTGQWYQCILLKHVNEISLATGF